MNVSHAWVAFLSVSCHSLYKCFLYCTVRGTVKLINRLLITSSAVQFIFVITICPQDAPRLSYAQILAQKNREITSNAIGGETTTTGGLPPNSTPGTLNGSNLVQNDNGVATYGGGRAFTQSTNAFREHGNYHGGQQHGPRSSQRGPSKDGLRYDGPPQSSQQPNNGRRNSKENRISSKFDRRKHDTRLK